MLAARLPEYRVNPWNVLRRDSGALLLPGVNVYQDSLGVTPANVDDQLGGVFCAIGSGVSATQTTSGFKPIRRQGVKIISRYNEDFRNGVWTKTGGTNTPAANIINFPNLNEPIAEANTVFASVGKSCTATVKISGSGTIYLGVTRQGAGPYEDTKIKITLTVIPTVYSVTHTIVNAGQTGFIGFMTRNSDGTATTVTCDYFDIAYGSKIAAHREVLASPLSDLTAGSWIDFDLDDYLTISAIPGVTAATVVKAIKNTGQQTVTGVDFTAGVNINDQLLAGYAIFPSAPSANDLLIVQRYMETLAA